MKILYLSALSSVNTINELYHQTGRNPGFAAGKFNRLVVKGLIQNSADVTVLSSLSVSFSISRKVFWWKKDETEDGVTYKYIPFINLPVLRQVCQFIYVFFYALFWGVRDKDEKVIICDVLKSSLCIPAIFASHINHVRRVGIMTDMPGLTVGWKTHGMKYKAIITINKWYLSSFHYYVFLTEAMNEVNKRGRPYIIMEGLVDSSLQDNDSKHIKEQTRVILYAGGINERYGIRTMVNAVQTLPFNDIRFDIYGSGPMSEELKLLSSKDSRVKYYGIVPNDEVVAAEYRATLLVNPRPTTEVFTKYSFPSKNMEYMVSGTPLLTTKLPGMPEDYYPYVYLFEEETVDGYRKALDLVLSNAAEELDAKGKLARNFGLEKKNNIVQARRILDMLNSVRES